MRKLFVREPLFFILFELLQKVFFLDPPVEGGAVVEFEYWNIEPVELIKSVVRGDINIADFHIIPLHEPVKHFLCGIA